MTASAPDDADFYDSFAPLASPTDHTWCVAPDGTSARCSKCHLALVARVHLLGRAPVAELQIAARTPPARFGAPHVRCPGAPLATP